MFRNIFLFILLWASVSTASATTILYNITNTSGNTWEYMYTVKNDILSVDIEEFTIFFDSSLYENLVATTTPIDWDPLVIQPDLGIPDDGFYDALALVFGISPGEILGGFGVQFDFLGIGTPGSQAFDIVDAFTFDLLDSGITTLASVPTPTPGPAPTPVPEPNLLLLMSSGLLVFAGRKRYQQ